MAGWGVPQPVETNRWAVWLADSIVVWLAGWVGLGWMVRLAGLDTCFVGWLVDVMPGSGWMWGSLAGWLDGLLGPMGVWVGRVDGLNGLLISVGQLVGWLAGCMVGWAGSLVGGLVIHRTMLIKYKIT